MISRDEAYDIISGINETAHERSWDTWSKADELEDSDNEDDWSAAEELRDEASEEQASYFREEFDELDDDTREAVMHYVETDADFQEDFIAWYGKDDYEADFG